jgi:folylpolyglutamate synthase/dihydropteroate synthase
LPAASACSLFTNPAEAFTQATADASKDSVIVCFGSFLTVAAVQDVVTAG